MGPGGKPAGPEPEDAPLQGSGDVEPGSGLPRWVDDPRVRRRGQEGHSWAVLLAHWGLIEADLADRGIDVDDPALMRGRSWRWLRARILGLFSAPPVGWRDVTTGTGKSARTHAEPVWATRVQTALHTPRKE